MPSTATASQDTLKALCDTNFATTGTIGFLALLKADLATNLFTVNASTDILTTASAHGLVTGSRLRVAVSGGSLPTPLVANTDYYAIVLSSTTLRLATTLANATAGSPVAIDLTDTGSGTLTLNEQVLTKDDPIAVLLNKEITHPAWTQRAAISNTGAAIIVGNNAQKTGQSVIITNNDTTALSWKHHLYLIGGGVTNAIASTPTGNYNIFLGTEATTLSVASGESKTIVSTIKVAPV